jgi:tetratricopeptide (TPR) repeat protein
MEPAEFGRQLQAIKNLDASDGPSRNIFEPRFEARTKAETLAEEVEKSLSANHDTTRGQLARVKLFLGINHYETDEIREGERLLLEAYSLAKGCVSPGLKPDAVATIENVLTEEVDIANAPTTALELFIEVLTSIGVFLSTRTEVSESTQDARRVLHVAEAAYLEAAKRGEPSAELEKLMTTTTFCLGQAYGALGNVRLASRYIHETMVRQLKSRLDYSPRDWATNAVHLAGFYAGQGRFPEAVHCIQAATATMPHSPADETTLGVVAWGEAKVFKALLRAAIDGDAVPAKVDWWQDLPVEGVSSPQPVSLPSTFSPARDVFRTSFLALRRAAQYYTFDTCCTDFVAIHQDMAELYKLLAHFEADPERKATMLLRRVECTAPFPEQLSFTAYATLIRQLWFDLGESASDLFDFRLEQRERGEGRPLSDRQLNFLNRKAHGYFTRFLDTFKDDKTGKRPRRVDNELQVPIFRAIMRIARLNGKRCAASPQIEHENISDTVATYEDALAFANNNGMHGSEIGVELDLAQQMVKLLPTKQREVRRAFS